MSKLLCYVLKISGEGANALNPPRPGCALGLHPLESGPGGMTIYLTLLSPILVWKQQNYPKLPAVDREVFLDLQGCCPRDSPQRQRGHQNE